MTSHQARKGFEIRFNPNRQRSAALYQNLNILQYTDGTDMLNINRDDDQAGFRLDTMTTHHQYTTPSVEGKEALTTHPDYCTNGWRLKQQTNGSAIQGRREEISTYTANKAKSIDTPSLTAFMQITQYTMSQRKECNNSHCLNQAL